MARTANDMELFDTLSESDSPSLSTECLAKARNADPVLLSMSFSIVMPRFSFVLTHPNIKNVCWHILHQWV